MRRNCENTSQRSVQELGEWDVRQIEIASPQNALQLLPQLRPSWDVSTARLSRIAQNYLKTPRSITFVRYILMLRLSTSSGTAGVEALAT